MSRNLPDSGFGEARLREHRMLELLAKVAAGLHEPDDLEEEALLRQLGYACHLARGRVEDPSDNLGRVATYCMERLKDVPVPPGPYRDRVQERWGAPWHLDMGKLRSELPVYLLMLEREVPEPSRRRALS